MVRWVWKVKRKIDNAETVRKKILLERLELSILFPKELVKHNFCLVLEFRTMFQICMTVGLLKFSVLLSLKATTQWSKTRFRKTNH